jgi:hypothetical protein
MVYVTRRFHSNPLREGSEHLLDIELAWAVGFVLLAAAGLVPTVASGVVYVGSVYGHEINAYGLSK